MSCGTLKSPSDSQLAMLWVWSRFVKGSEKKCCTASFVRQIFHFLCEKTTLLIPGRSYSFVFLLWYWKQLNSEQAKPINNVDLKSTAPAGNPLRGRVKPLNVTSTWYTYDILDAKRLTFEQLSLESVFLQGKSNPCRRCRLMWSELRWNWSLAVVFEGAFSYLDQSPPTTGRN